MRGGGPGALGWMGVGKVQASGDAQPTPTRKLSFQENLRLSGIVTSRLNLWISKTQESGDGDPQVPPEASPRALSWQNDLPEEGQPQK